MTFVQTPEIARALRLREFGAGQLDSWQPWLPRRASDAFICCVGAGPWKFQRRQNVQRQGLMWLAGRDISEIGRGHVTEFPLGWQNAYVERLHDSMQRSGPFGTKDTFEHFCFLLKQGPHDLKSAARTRKIFDLAVRVPTGEPMPKVLSLFCRDYLEVPSFPIDRHVRAQLYSLDLPADEDELLRLCGLIDLDPIILARRMGTQQLDGGNPDWTSWQYSKTTEEAQNGR